MAGLPVCAEVALVRARRPKVSAKAMSLIIWETSGEILFFQRLTHLYVLVTALRTHGARGGGAETLDVEPEQQDVAVPNLIVAAFGPHLAGVAGRLFAAERYE